LIASLKSDDPYILNTIAWLLIKMGDSAREPLIKMLQDDDPNLRSISAGVLIKLGWLPLKDFIKSQEPFKSTQEIEMDLGFFRTKESRKKPSSGNTNIFEGISDPSYSNNLALLKRRERLILSQSGLNLKIISS